MGCQESKTVKVQPFSPNQNGVTRQPSGKIDLTKSATDSDITVNDGISKQRRKRKSKSGRSFGSNGTLEDVIDGSDRGGSATSKNSTNSQDSGLGLAEDYSFVISEESHPDAVRGVEDSFEQKDLELSVVGTACPRRQSAREKRREEMVILQALREEGLISLPKAKSSGGLSFEVVVDKPEEAVRRPPARLAKLEKRKKKRRVLTEDQIREKLERAERRRKEREQSKLDRIREWENKHEQNQQQVDNSVQEARKVIETQSTQKMDSVSDKREKRLQAIQEKMRKQAEHAEKVRMRRLAAKQAAIEAGNTEQDGQDIAPSAGIVHVQPKEQQESDEIDPPSGLVHVQPMAGQLS